MLMMRAFTIAPRCFVGNAETCNSLATNVEIGKIHNRTSGSPYDRSWAISKTVFQDKWEHSRCLPLACVLAAAGARNFSFSLGDARFRMPLFTLLTVLLGLLPGGVAGASLHLARRRLPMRRP